MDEASQDVVVEVFKSEGDAAEVFEASVDCFDRPVGYTPVEKREDIPAPLMKAAS